jgi:uncharacterized protein (TIGR02996 family)
MPQHDDFLRAILAEPDEDAPRLVYADWLDEHGDPRGEFIRVQIESARLEEDHPRQAELKPREGELFDRHGREWLAPLEPLLKPRLSGFKWPFARKGLRPLLPWFDRGFVGRLELTVKWFLRWADDLLRLTPLRRLRLRMLRSEVDGLCRCPSLAQILGLGLFGAYSEEGLEAQGMAQLAASPHLSGVRSLDLSWNPLGDDGAAALAGAGWLPRVQGLCLEGSRVTAQGLRTLLDSAQLGPVTALNLSHNPVEDVGAAAVAGHPALAGLRSLSLAGCGLGPEGAEVLVRSRTLAKVSELDLSVNDLGPAVAEHLASAMSLRLRSLDLRQCRLGDEGIMLLASWPGLANLRRLCLNFNDISDTGADALAASPYLGRLAVLDLGHNDLSPEAEARLRRAPSLRHLWRLHLVSLRF